MPQARTVKLTDLPSGHPCTDCPVRPITICRGLEPATLAALRALGTMQRLNAGQAVFHEGDPARRVFMLSHGSLKIYTLLRDGRRQVTGFMFPGDFLGTAVDEEYAFTVEALKTAELWWFSREAFESFLTEYPDVERELYRLAIHELAAAQQQMVLLGRKAATERVASFLLMLLDRAERVSGESRDIVDLPMSRLDIADYLGLTKETVSRVISALRSDRLVRLDALDRVQILNKEGLREAAEGDLDA